MPDLEHVLWLGGPPDAGKTSVANLLAKRHGLLTYKFDAHERDHIRRSDPCRHPHLHRLRPWLEESDALQQSRRLDEAWVSRTPETMCADAIAGWSERFGLVLEDLQALPAETVILAEGPGFFPEVLLPHLSDIKRAVWLIPTASFKQASHERRNKTAFAAPTSNPHRARTNHIERDLLLAQHYRTQLQARGLPFLTIDETTTLRKVAAKVEAHFAQFLP